MTNYDIRRKVAIAVSEWISEQAKDPKKAQTYKSLLLNLSLSLGAPESMVKKQLELYNLEVVNGELKKINE